MKQNKNIIPNEGKKTVYAETKRLADRQKRERYRNAKTNDLKSRRLWVLLNFMKKHGWRQIDLARALGWSPQRLQHVIAVADDVQLSQLVTMIRVMGGRLTVELVSEQSSQEQGELYDIVTSSVGVSFNQKPDDERFLSFLRRAIADSGLSTAALTRASGLQRASILGPLANDDISVKALLKLVKAINLRVRWKIVPLGFFPTGEVYDDISSVPVE